MQSRITITLSSVLTTYTNTCSTFRHAHGFFNFINCKLPYLLSSQASLASWFSNTVGCALFSKFLGLNAVLVELDELSLEVPSFLKSDHGKLLRIAILCLVTWVSRGTLYMRHGLVITTRDCARGDSMRNFIRELCPGVFYTYSEPMFLLTDRL